MNVQLRLSQNTKFFIKVGATLLFFMAFADFVTERARFWPLLLNKAWIVAYLIAANYVFYYIFRPLIGIKHRLRSIALLGLQFFIFTFGLFVWRMIGVFLHLFTEFNTYSHLTDAVCAYAPYSAWSFFYFGIIKHVYDYVQLKHTAQALRIEKQAAELNFLKAQTNPHFLFNTLNNIYALAREKSDLAPESILRLSEILRFMLYETNVKHIKIGDEVKIMTDYIELEKLRYDQDLRVEFKCEIRDMEQPITPLLLMPMVENAFKHGASEMRTRPPLISIFLSTVQHRLFFQVKNTTDTADCESTAIKENIGLGNLRRQLELLYRAYELKVQQEPHSFTATLQIDLQSHV